MRPRPLYLIAVTGAVLTLSTIGALLMFKQSSPPKDSSTAQDSGSAQKKTSQSQDITLVDKDVDPLCESPNMPLTKQDIESVLGEKVVFYSHAPFEISESGGDQCLYNSENHRIAVHYFVDDRGTYWPKLEALAHVVKVEGFGDAAIMTPDNSKSTASFNAKKGSHILGIGFLAEPPTSDDNDLLRSMATKALARME